MCIRDSVKLLPLGPGYGFHAGAPGAPVEQPGDAGFGFFDNAPGAPAVSYTHLRAHETVLDLVCRLLLEKKKTHTTTNIINVEHEITRTV